ncbi:hypothetical protein HRI_000835400 [Hibiscus trionum]|uniref:Uncharacterized protein n=1 Tax=Hibiscus trionum TaxID=183268 RepID=A0A9W7LPV2_HIBTR|nr:hypothetical protein HRI_000835400 [Hibiscus trionum]
MGPCAKTMILLLVLAGLDPFIGRVKGLDHGANPATNEGIQVQTRKLRLDVDVQRDYNPVTPNPKHEPGPPRGKPGTTSTGGGR